MAAARNAADSMTALARRSIPCIRYLLKTNDRTTNQTANDDQQRLGQVMNTDSCTLLVSALVA
jgi:hypothetical protein